MVTEEDLKAIVVHKKYNRKKPERKERKRKRSSSSSQCSNSSVSSESSNTRSKKDIKIATSSDIGFIPSRFLKKEQNRSAEKKKSYRESGEPISYPGYNMTSDRLKGKREKSYDRRGDDRRVREDRGIRDDRGPRDDRNIREERAVREDRREDRERARDDRYSRDDRHKEERPREHEIVRDDRRRDEERGEREGYRREKSFDMRFPRENREEGYRRRYREEAEKQDHKRRSKRDEDDRDYDPISDEELALLEEDIGIIEIYKELEREMKSKKYTAYLDDIDFTVLETLDEFKQPQKGPIDRLLNCGYSASFGSRAITEKVKDLCLKNGVVPPLKGAYSLNKVTPESVFRTTLSKNLALSSFTDVVLREKLNNISNSESSKISTESLISEEPINTSVFSECLKWYNSVAGTNFVA